jgi:UDP-GlcNAc:undecaprenyl-phosphate GlcNAc-1-phosphate transferase
MTTLFYILGTSWLLSLLLTPLARTLAARCGLVDRPDGRRKIHVRSVPLAGGLAVFLAGVLTLSTVLMLPSSLSDPLAEEGESLIGLLLAALIIIAVGVADDYRLLRGRHKLLGQLFAVLVVIQFGLVVREVRLFSWVFELGPLSVPFTCLWLLGAINSLNLIDGMDGLLGSVGLILSGALAAMAVLNNERWAEAYVAMALAGALLGFLRFNLPPASIFLGDAGSMLIGLIIGTLAIKASLKGVATAAMAAPTALLAIPFLDTAAAIIRRKLTGRSIYTTDRGHLHHCLQGRGLSNARVVLLISFCCLFTVSGALVSVALEAEFIALLAAGVVVSMLVVTQMFGHAEFLLVRKRVGGMARSLLRGQRSNEPRQTEVRLQGSLDWAELWNNLISRAPWLHIKMMRLNVNAPALHEGYHAHWECHHEEGEDNRLWRLDMPLVVHGQTIGRLELSGLNDTGDVSKRMTHVMDLVEDVEAAAADLIGIASSDIPRRRPLEAPRALAENSVNIH